MTTKTPVVGDGVTYGYGSDSYPGTVTWVSASGKSFRFREDDHTHVSGNFMEGNAVFTYVPNPYGQEYQVSLRKNGRYYMKGNQYAGKRSVSVGHRSFYRDPHR